MRSLLPPVSILAIVVSLYAAPTATPATETAPTKVPAAAPVTDTKSAPIAQVVEKAPENFPLTLRGFFGKGDKAEVSVQDKTSGKSVWLKPGSSHSGWKLERADAIRGRAVFSQGARRIIVFQAGESHEPTTGPLKSARDSVVRKKLLQLLNDPKLEALYYSLCEEAREASLIVDPNAPPSDVREDLLEAIELKRILLAKTGPEAEALKSVVLPECDAMIKVYPDNPHSYPRQDAPDEGDTEAVAEEAARAKETLRVYELADELYRRRNGGK